MLCLIFAAETVAGRVVVAIVVVVVVAKHGLMGRKTQIKVAHPRKIDVSFDAETMVRRVALT